MAGCVQNLVTCLSLFPPNPNVFLSGSRDCTVKVWDRRTDRSVGQATRQRQPAVYEDPHRTCLRPEKQSTCFCVHASSSSSFFPPTSWNSHPPASKSAIECIHIFALHLRSDFLQPDARWSLQKLDAAAGMRRPMQSKARMHRATVDYPPSLSRASLASLVRLVAFKHCEILYIASSLGLPAWATTGAPASAVPPTSASCPQVASARRGRLGWCRLTLPWSRAWTPWMPPPSCRQAWMACCTAGTSGSSARR